MARATISARSDFFGSERTGFTVFTVSAVGDAADDSLRSTLLHDADGEPDGAVVMDTAGAVAAEGCEQVDSTSARCVLPAMGPAPFVEVSLDGGPGNDRLVGDGVGRADVARARGGGPDVVACHHTPARVVVDGFDLVLACPRATVSRHGTPRPRILEVGRDPNADAPADGRTAFLGAGCPVDMPVACVVDVRLRDSDGAAGHGHVVARPGFTVGATIALTRSASRRARCAGRLRLAYTLTFRTGDGTVVRLHRRHSEPVRQRSSAC
jgi:hypothetical protein